MRAVGYQVLTAYDGFQALEIVELKGCPDLILLDVMIPGMDGFEVLSKLGLNADASHIPIIMFTVKGDSKSILKSQDLKATDYVIKPFDMEKLLSLIKKHIR